MHENRTQLGWLKSESIHILREVIAEARIPVMLFSADKDSTVMAYLALRAFYPSKPPFPLPHVDSTWEFRSLLDFRDALAKEHGIALVTYANEEGRAAGINPIDHGDRYTALMRTEPLKKALDAGGYDVILGGARGMRRNSERRNGSSRCATPATSGTPASNARSFGICTTPVWVKGSPLACSRSPTGPSPISGATR